MESCLENPMDGGAWWAAVHGAAKSQTRLSDFTFTFHFHALEKEMATHSSVLAWRIPGTVEPGGLPSMGSHRVGHDWSDLAAAAARIPQANNGMGIPLSILATLLTFTMWYYFILFNGWVIFHCIHVGIPLIFKAWVCYYTLNTFLDPLKFPLPTCIC